MALTAEAKGKLRLSDTATGERTVVSIALTRVAELNTVERLWFLTTDDRSSFLRTREIWKVSGRSWVKVNATLLRSSEAKASLTRSTDAQVRSGTSRVGTRGFTE